MEFILEENKRIDLTESSTLAREAVKVLLEKKALCVKLFDVREKTSVTDSWAPCVDRCFLIQLSNYNCHLVGM